MPSPVVPLEAELADQLRFGFEAEVGDGSVGVVLAEGEGEALLHALLI
jgi:hypothetical protein